VNGRLLLPDRRQGWCAGPGRALRPNNRNRRLRPSRLPPGVLTDFCDAIDCPHRMASNSTAPGADHTKPPSWMNPHNYVTIMRHLHGRHTEFIRLMVLRHLGLHTPDRRRYQPIGVGSSGAARPCRRALPDQRVVAERYGPWQACHERFRWCGRWLGCWSRWTAPEGTQLGPLLDAIGVPRPGVSERLRRPRWPSLSRAGRRRRWRGGGGGCGGGRRSAPTRRPARAPPPRSACSSWRRRWPAR
jgi:hypothetical protein